MKRLFIALAILFSPTLFISAAHAEKIKIDDNYQLKAWMGFSPRVVEFTPKGNPDYTCIFLTGKETAQGMNCFPKKKLNNPSPTD